MMIGYITRPLFVMFGIITLLCLGAIGMGVINEGDTIGYIGPRGDTQWFDNQFGVNRYDVRTRNITSLTSPQVYPQLFSWSPNGDYVGVIARPFGDAGATSALYVLRANGHDMRLMSGDLAVIIASERPPFWSDDNQNMVFQAMQEGGNVVQFYKGYLDGTPPELIDISHPLAQAYIQNFFPTYQTAPNGKYRVLVDYRDNEWGLFLVIGDKQEKIYPLTSETMMPDAADWSPDSQWIALSQRQNRVPMINVITMSGDVVFQIKQGRYPLWKPSD
jgi:Tol biopolymer transport system component